MSGAGRGDGEHVGVSAADGQDDPAGADGEAGQRGAVDRDVPAGELDGVAAQEPGTSRVRVRGGAADAGDASGGQS
jgi:hypothetical protein